MQMYSDAVRFHPWIGTSYGTNSQWGLPFLILGESHYDTDGVLLGSDSTQKVLEEYIQFRPKKLQYYTKVMNSVSGLSGSSEKPDLSRFWNSVAFYNYVQFTVPKGEAPTQETWNKSRKPFDEVISKLQPSCILIVSMRLWDNLTPHLTSHSHFYLNDKTMKSGVIASACVGAIPHVTSSRGYKPLDWNPVIARLIEKAVEASS